MLQVKIQVSWQRCMQNLARSLSALCLAVASAKVPCEQYMNLILKGRKKKRGGGGGKREPGFILTFSGYKKNKCQEAKHFHEAFAVKILQLLIANLFIAWIG